MKKIKEFIFGNVDGKNEASKDYFSLDSFFNYQGVYEKLEEGKFLILGNKGTGKSFLLEYFRKKKELEGNIFADIHLEDFFSKKQVIQNKNEIIDNIKLLKWIIYIELSKVILSSDIIDQNSKEVKKLNKFMLKNEFDLKLDTNRIIESSLEKGIKGNLSVEKGFFKGLIERVRTWKDKEEYGKYYEYIEDLETVIIKILQNEWESRNYIYIIFDELDNINDFNKDTYNILLNLIKVANDLNYKWERQAKIKILIGMRLDIFLKLNSTYTNKIKEDSGIVLSWGKDESNDSPLLQMIFHKMRVQDSELSLLPDENIRKKIFSLPKIRIHKKKLPISKYILGKTLLRPRDIISFFNKAKPICGDKEYITPEDLQRIGNDFSEYFYTELRNQSHGLMDIELFDEGIKLLKNYRKTIFSYEELKNYLREDEQTFMKISESNLEKVISNFFEIGLLGNMKSINGHGSKAYFKYKDDNEINLKENLTLHYGIRPYLKLNIENNLSFN